ncbi:hypothetical protein GCM10011361_18770 [Muriicola marianensis]|uniref:DUF2490 domain-containing protein n=2 Tax=Muriicola marianensis TaxID=1324801 RepID=A0ABQ1R0S8_9FLAO|nr:hypothetical protein GCM10011361_18770 [Muriicola marianensis]
MNSLMGQDSFTTYFQPQLAFNYKVLPFYSHNLTIGNRNYIYRDGETQFQGRNLDITHFSTFSSGANSSLGLGLMYRFRELFEPERNNEFRLTQQMNITSRPLIARYGHRLRSEQRIFPDLTIHRFRYRFTLDFPLQGEKVDVRETYMILNAEALLSAGRGMSSQFDQRFTATLGWLLEEDLQWQVGLEYRMEDYTASTRPVLFLNSSLVFSL